MPNDLTLFKILLKERGYSVTEPRLLVFEQLQGQEPIDMAELHQNLTGLVDRASLYRIIKLFEQLGIAQRLQIGWKYKIELSDRFSDHHHHLTCTNCKRVIPINTEALEAFIQQAATQQSFAPSSHQVEIQGLCQICQSNIHI
ncbi:MAG TPA: transcriptional repressor [Patescibacteria group bacterium]|nr:transcriptional repressor [Patescibacteria group bacterium]